jgi:MFS superfamily sulfate permease-like transporter
LAIPQTRRFVVASQVYRNVEQYPSAEMVPGVLVVRLDAPVYFANVQWMEDKLVAYEADALRCADHFSVFDCQEGAGVVGEGGSPAERI